MDLTYFDKVLKDVYGPAIQEQLSLMNIFSDFVEENETATWTGRQVRYPIHIGRNQGVGASAEAEALPRAGKQQFAEVVIPAKYNYGRVRLTAQVMKQSMSDRGAFERAMEAEMTGLVRDLANEMERQRFSAGTGVLCLAYGAVSDTTSTTFAVDSPYGISGQANGCRFLNPGATIAVIHPTVDATVEGTFTVSTINAAGTVVTPTAALGFTISDNARLVRWNPDDATGATNSLGHESMGLLGLIDDGTYVGTLHGVNRTTYPIFKSPVVTSVATLTLDEIQQGIDAVDELGRGDFGSNGVFFCHHSVRRVYLALLDSVRRYTGQGLFDMDGGVKHAGIKRPGEITYGDRPWRIAKHAPYEMLFGILKGSLTRYVLVKGEWADEDGTILRNVFGYDIWDGFYRIWDTLHTDRPNDGFRLDGITATLNVNHIY
jgi:hypothetical protein